jgi:photosystem II stability/assembly factor-like uncharacterized protein
MAGLPSAQVVALAVDPLSHQTVYAGVSGAGVYRTTDGGAHWGAVNSGLTNTSVQALSIGKQTEGLVYAATFGGGIFRSLDGGSHWSPLNAGLANLGALAVLADDSRGRVFAGIDGSSAQEFDFFAGRGPVIPVSAPRPRKTRHPVP